MSKFELNDISKHLDKVKAVEATKEYNMKKFGVIIHQLASYQPLMSDAPLDNSVSDEFGNQFLFDDDGNITRIYMP